MSTGWDQLLQMRCTRAPNARQTQNLAALGEGRACIFNYTV